MNVTLIGRHLEITPHLKAHVDEKVKKIEKFGEHIIESELVLFKEGVKDVAEGKVHLGHIVLTAKGSGNDMYMAVNDVVDKLAAQLHRYEDKLHDRKRHPSESQ
jgi:putative sigma-54 modulation protein